MYNLHQTDGLILSSVDFGEADRFYAVYSQNFGKISVLAKSVRLEKSKLRGHLEPYSLARISFIEGKDCLRLTDAEEISSASQICGNGGDTYYVLGRISLLINRLVEGPEKDEALWNFLRYSFLYLLDGGRGGGYSLNDFESLFKTRLLHRLGYVSLPEGILGQAIASDDWPAAPADNLNSGDFEKLFQKGLAESQL